MEYSLLYKLCMHFAANLDEYAVRHVVSPEIMHNYTACIRTCVVTFDCYYYLTTSLPMQSLLC